MNDIEICKKCIYYETALFCHCQLIEKLCINNCEFLDRETVIERTERQSSCDIATNKLTERGNENETR